MPNCGQNLEYTGCSCPSSEKEGNFFPGQKGQFFRDNDARYPILVLSLRNTVQQDPNILCGKRQKQETGSWNLVNYWPTTRLKYFCPSGSLFLKALSFSSCSSYFSPHKRHTGRMKAAKRSAKKLSYFPLIFFLLFEIIQLSSSSPTFPISGPVKVADDKSRENLKGLREDDVYNLEYDVSNEHGKEDELQSSDDRGQNFEFKSDNLRKGHLRGHGSQKGVRTSTNVDVDGDSNLLKFTFASGELPNNNKIDRQENQVRHFQHHSAVMKMPTAIRTQVDSASTQLSQQRLTTAQVTNDFSHQVRNISGSGNGDKGVGFNLKNNNDLDNINSGTQVKISAENEGKCWKEIDGKVYPLEAIGPPKNPFTICCNGTNNLALTLRNIPDEFDSQVISIHVKDSSISRLNLSLFHRFPRLGSLSVTHSNVTHIIGTCPTGLKALNISFNAVKKLDSSIFQEFSAYDDDTDGNDDERKSYNMGEIPSKNFLSSANLNKSEQASSEILEKNLTPNRFAPGHKSNNKSVPITTDKNRELPTTQGQMMHFDSSSHYTKNFKQPGKTDSKEAVYAEAAETNGINDDDLVGSENMLKRKRDSGATAATPLTHFSPTSLADGGCSKNDIFNGKCKTVSEEATKQIQSEENASHQRDSEKNESYSYEDDDSGSESRDYYPQPTLSSSAVVTSTSSTNTRRSNDKLNDIEAIVPLQTTTKVSPSDESVKNIISLQDIDLSHNKISEIPKAVLNLQNLKSLRLSGNQLKCDFVWEKLADWYTKSNDPNILKDGDNTFCGVVDDVRVFQFTVLGVLKAKKDVVETCKTVDKSICHDCGLYSLNKQPGNGYNLSHQSSHGSVAIALKLDCSFQNLTNIPDVPLQTWQLNISGNSIKDLSSLKKPMYENLLILDADANEISTLDGLTGTSFLDRYNYLSLQNNRFAGIPTTVLSSLKTMKGQGVTFLGGNYIDCDCDVVKEIKPLLLENSKQIKDLKELFCKDMKAHAGETFVAVKDLQYTDLCYMDTEESNEMYLYLIIFVELLLILVIVGKVWHDQRTFRRTGILPWCSAKMPRLPCDAILESVKEPPHFNRSSSTNVRSFACEPPTQSISSHVQLREVRSNSGQSEKSSQISQLSSFPSSSRTSSV